MAIWLGWRGSLKLKDFLPMVLFNGLRPEGQEVFAYCSLLGYRMMEFQEDRATGQSPINLRRYNASIILSSEGQPTKEHQAFMLEKYLFSPDRMNVRLFQPVPTDPKLRVGSNGKGPSRVPGVVLPDQERGVEARFWPLPNNTLVDDDSSEEPFLFKTVYSVHIGLLAIFNELPPDLIEFIAVKFELLNDVPRQLIYSYKGE